MELTKAELILASRLLDSASDEFSNHGCNDMSSSMFKGISKVELDELVEAFNAANPDEDEDDPRPIESIGDWVWMSFLSDRLKAAAGAR